ncbi:MAG: hypothetical protein HZB25_12640 [Candidatus Eisenbacteria bacterium]|nr:hypothetical protein [Candidatus Eisenbacteria bacterium]
MDATEATLTLEMEEDHECYVGSLDLEGFLASLPEILRTCLEHRRGATPEAETSLDPAWGFEGPGPLSTAPATGGCEV